MLAAALAADSIPAQEANGYLELIVGHDEVRTEDSTGRREDRQSDSLLQRYSLDLVWRLYPNLQVVVGGIFERDAVTLEQELGKSRTTQRKIRPYITAALQTAMYSATTAYYRNQDELSTGGLTAGAVQEIYNSTVGWRPERLPSLLVRFIRTNDFDLDRRIQDSTTDTLDLVSEYQPADFLQLYYRGARENFDDRLSDLLVRGTSHAGRVTYGDSWWDQRVQAGGEYNVNYRETEVLASGGGEVVTVLFPLRGLSDITDTPDLGALVPNPALIDGDRTASAVINLGLPPLGGDERPRNIGLDLAGGVTLNTLQVWVDRELPPEIANSFSWDIYTSPDNLAWVLRQTVFPADFRVFEKRFEIRFADLTTRYVKAVVAPLARSVTDAAAFPDILVTECSAALRTSAMDARGRSSRTSQFLTSSVRARILNHPSLDYEWSYFARDDGVGPAIYTLSNGLSLRHAFNPVYSLAARVAREDSRETEGNRVTYLYSTSVRAVPYQTLQNSLVFSGRSSEINGESSNGASVFLYSTAELYRGVNANLGLGYSAATEANGVRTENTRVNAQTTLVPHRTMALNLLYQDNTGTSRGGTLAGERRVGTRAGQASLTYRPLSTLYLFFSYRTEHVIRFGDRFIRNYSMSWSPFRDGSLQVLFSYDDAYQSNTESQSRIFSPRVRWNITERWYAELACQRSDFDSALETRKTDSLTGSMRILF